MDLFRCCLLICATFVVAACSGSVGSPEAAADTREAAPSATSVEVAGGEAAVDASEVEQQAATIDEDQEAETASDLPVEPSTDPGSESDEEESAPADSTEDTATEDPAPVEAATEDADSSDEATVRCGLAVSIVFSESAPRDQMAISNDSEGTIALASVEFDLSQSVGDVIFDTLDGGSGVEVFQDFQVEAGDATLANNPVADDGATYLRLEFANFAPGESFVFSIDVDDQLTNSDLGQIQVSGAELAGAQVVLTVDSGASATAVFDDSDAAEFISPC